MYDEPVWGASNISANWDTTAVNRGIGLVVLCYVIGQVVHIYIYIYMCVYVYGMV